MPYPLSQALHRLSTPGNVVHWGRGPVTSVIWSCYSHFLECLPLSTPLYPAFLASISPTLSCSDSQSQILPNCTADFFQPGSELVSLMDNQLWCKGWVLWCRRRYCGPLPSAPPKQTHVPKNGIEVEKCIANSACFSLWLFSALAGFTDDPGLNESIKKKLYSFLQSPVGWESRFKILPSCGCRKDARTHLAKDVTSGQPESSQIHPKAWKCRSHLSSW